jgi:ABC-type lipopolysaccharide export system ATPase subunit
MAQRSELIEVELPDNAGKTTTFYTYDGYLEENERRTIRQERRNFEQLKVTGAALFGAIGYFVPLSALRPPADSRFPSSASADTQSPSEDSSPGL